MKYIFYALIIGLIIVWFSWREYTNVFVTTCISDDNCHNVKTHDFIIGTRDLHITLYHYSEDLGWDK